MATTDFEVAVRTSMTPSNWPRFTFRRGGKPTEICSPSTSTMTPRARRQVMWSGLLSEEAGRERVRVARRQGRIEWFVVRGPATEHQGNAPVRDEQLDALYVVSSVYGHGVGQALLDQALGERPAQLWVAKNDGRARRFYERKGFRADGTEQSRSGSRRPVENRMFDAFRLIEDLQDAVQRGDREHLGSAVSEDASEPVPAEGVVVDVWADEDGVRRLISRHPQRST